MKINKLIRDINLPKNISIKLIDDSYLINGPKGQIIQKINENLKLEIFENYLSISVKVEDLKKKDQNKFTSILNTTCILFRNNFFGVVNLYTYCLILQGIGFKAKYDSVNRILSLSLGFSHLVNINIPSNIIIDVVDSINIFIKGVSKYEVSQLAANIRNQKIVEIYKGNGIRYRDEQIKLKSPKKNK